MTSHDETRATPARPAAYIRVASAGSPDDPAVQQQRQRVLSAAAELGWPEPAVYTDTGTGWHRTGPALATLAGHIQAGHHDAVITCDLARISRDVAGVAAFHDLCTSHATTLHTVTDGPVTADTLPILASSG